MGAAYEEREIKINLPLLFVGHEGHPVVYEVNRPWQIRLVPVFSMAERPVRPMRSQ